jgi:hypothetical protein
MVSINSFRYTSNGYCYLIISIFKANAVSNSIGYLIALLYQIATPQRIEIFLMKLHWMIMHNKFNL